MAMLIAWQTVNAVRHPQTKSFSRAFLIVAPGITIKDRLRVLQPNDPDSYYKTRELIPADMVGDIEKAKIFAEEYSDIELIEIISLHPLCTKSISNSVKKTGRVLLLNTPLHLTTEILNTCFWHLEAQPEHTQNSDHQNLSRLRARLLET